MAYTGSPELTLKVRQYRRKRKIKRIVKLSTFIFLWGIVLGGLILIITPKPVKVLADSTVIIVSHDLEVRDDDTPRRGFIPQKYNISIIPAGYEIISATLRVHSVSGSSSGTVTIYRSTNQTWEEGDGISILQDVWDNIELPANYSFLGGERYENLDVKIQVEAAYDAGNSNCTLVLNHASYPLLDPVYSINDFVQNYYLWPSGISINSLESLQESYRPRLTIVYQAIPPGITVEYDFPNYDTMTSTVTMEKFWNGTKLLYRIYFYPYEDLTNITVSQLPTDYSFSYISPNVSDWTDTISSDGQIIFIDLYEGTYEAYFDPGEDWHILHINLFAPDGVGLMWESFVIYINDTRVPYPPEYDIQSGYYEYEVQDYFEQTVFSGSFTIHTTDSSDVYQSWEVPLFKVSFHNGDIVPYRIEITRNSITRKHPAPPKGEATEVRLYGLSTNVPYTIGIYHGDTGELMEPIYTLNVPNYPVGRYINYDNDERVDFPSYKWIQESFQTIQGQLVSQNQLVILIGVGLFITVIVQTQGILKRILQKPLVKRKNQR